MHKKKSFQYIFLHAIWLIFIFLSSAILKSFISPEKIRKFVCFSLKMHIEDANKESRWAYRTRLNAVDECFGEKGEQSSFSCFSLFPSKMHFPLQLLQQHPHTVRGVRKKFKSNYLNMRSFIMIDFNTLSSKEETWFLESTSAWCCRFQHQPLWCSACQFLWCLISIYGFFIFFTLLCHDSMMMEKFLMKKFYDHVELIERCNLMMRVMHHEEDASGNKVASDRVMIFIKIFFFDFFIYFCYTRARWKRLF